MDKTMVVIAMTETEESRGGGKKKSEKENMDSIVAYKLCRGKG